MRWLAALSSGVWGALLLTLLGGCVAGPSYPLLSPIAATGNFGFAEVPTAPGHYTVSYTTPPRLTGNYPGPHEQDADAARTLGFDMATWRAAQLAQAQGYTGFRVTDRRSDATIYPDPYYSPYDDPLFWDPAWERRRYAFYGGPLPPLPPRSYLQARVTIEVTLLQALQPGDYDTADAIRQLQRTYPGADGNPTPAS